jgi:hypothetical protein
MPSQAVGDQLEAELATLRSGARASEYASVEADGPSGGALADDALLDEWVQVYFRKRCCPARC